MKEKLRKGQEVYLRDRESKGGLAKALVVRGTNRGEYHWVSVVLQDAPRRKIPSLRGVNHRNGWVYSEKTDYLPRYTLLTEEDLQAEQWETRRSQLRRDLNGSKTYNIPFKKAKQLDTHVQAILTLLSEEYQQ